MSVAFQRAGVVGGGTMGAGISEVCARAGLDVVLIEADSTRAAMARKRIILRSLEKTIKRGKTDAADADDALDRVVTTADMAALAECAIVVEAVVEDKATKLDVFRRLAELVESEDAVLASNTSSIPIVELASATMDAPRTS
jgi:3-hydroxybutyryl-CoA dehydrogenase